MLSLYAADIEVQLDVDGYQFPFSRFVCDDDRWLQIRGNIRHPLGHWQFRDPCLTNAELATLAKWLSTLQPGGDDDGLGFWEPCLDFALTSQPEPAIVLTLAHECAPPWLSGEERYDGLTLLLPLALNPPADLAIAAAAILRRFPVRSTPD
ncbi:hypothetical protein SAMN02745857_00902 [Andreprevotia lacus DSM 23236]|jgi:hypothetical protein|uniref:Uncharacterized protein n=1 Tax=Andreprevotia lacus DSM 23236 TaxID=1121001 RepID=A0A1W1X8W1_9NEIS|nr:hypothetical protein [Andreprevotia lacus]SMC20303.1 hypothetical protein SAMN02745857_00902 [Andreprevotia lacus DSM 23236]